MKKKLSFSEIKNTLSRDEMKTIMAGSGAGSCTENCANGHASCTSPTGDCSRDDKANTISCDGRSYNC
jgi:hypothetical protein